MLILTIRTDKPEAEIGLFDATKQLDYDTWLAHRELAETIHTKIRQLLDEQNAGWHDIQGVVVFKGPGSFTGLRIGISTANALAYGLSVPVVSATGQEWIQTGIRRLLAGDGDVITLPEYGSPPHITLPKK